jgi:hypothetical protein
LLFAMYSRPLYWLKASPTGSESTGMVATTMLVDGFISIIVF